MLSLSGVFVYLWLFPVVSQIILPLSLLIAWFLRKIVSNFFKKSTNEVVQMDDLTHQVARKLGQQYS